MASGPSVYGGGECVLLRGQGRLLHNSSRCPGTAGTVTTKSGTASTRSEHRARPCPSGTGGGVDSEIPRISLPWRPALELPRAGTCPSHLDWLATDWVRPGPERSVMLRTGTGDITRMASLCESLHFKHARLTVARFQLCI